MLERRSALADAKPYTSPVLAIAERAGFSLLQVAGRGDSVWREISSVVGAIPERVGDVLASGGRTLMRVGPAQIWIIGPQTDDLADRLPNNCIVTPLSHGRTRIGLSGAPARDVLAKLIPVDTHPRAFAPGQFALTGIHHTPVTVHCTGDDSFDVYALRTFAADVWDAITDAAREFQE